MHSCGELRSVEICKLFMDGAEAFAFDEAIGDEELAVGRLSNSSK